jgi:hypothetical protein
MLAPLGWFKGLDCILAVANNYYYGGLAAAMIRGWRSLREAAVLSPGEAPNQARRAQAGGE